MDDSGTNLLVEDNQNDVELILAALNEGRLIEEICVAHEGQEALDYLYRWAVHRSRAAEYAKMKLLDFKLPRVDGLEDLQRIKADPDLKATPVVTLTSSREERDLLSSYNLGKNAFVVKPMSFRFFTETVNEVRHFWGVINQRPNTAEREL